jgi:hypothetical protein
MKKKGAKLFTNLQEGTYHAKVKDKDGCIAETSVTIGKDCSKDYPVPRYPMPPPFDIPVYYPHDPNDIAGPAGYGNKKWVSASDVLSYTIRFENDPKLATASANKVVITLPVDKNANMFSFQLGDISFGNFTLQVPPNTSHLFKHLDLKDSVGVNIDVTAGLDVTEGQAFWIFQALDPVSGLPNTDAESGVLLIDDSITHRGEGMVKFFIKPKITANTGDSINAFANIVFDANEPLQTNIAVNTIDALPPISKIKSVIPIDAENVKVSWTGSDDAGGCGIAEYQMLVSENNEPYQVYSSGLIDTSMIINVKEGAKYKFQTIAKDHVNNEEILKHEPDNTINALPQKFLISPNSTSLVCSGKELVVQWKNVNDLINIDLQLSADYGKSFTTIGQQLYVPDTVYYWQVPDTILYNTSYLIRAVNSLNNLPVDTEYFNIRSTPHIHLPDYIYGCSGLSILLDAGSDYPYYFWSTGDTSSKIAVARSGEYTVTVTDINSCSTIGLTVVDFDSPSFDLGKDTVIFDQYAFAIFGPNYFEKYVWTNGETSSQITVNNTGCYTLTVTDERGCTAKDSIHIMFNTSPPVLELGNDTSICGQTLWLNAGYGFDSYLWNDGSTKQYLEVSKTGKYYVTATKDSTAVSDTIRVTVTDFPVSFTGLDSTYILGYDTVQLVGTPAGGSFSGDGISDNWFVPALAGAGIHEITYFYADTLGCNNSQTQTVRVIPSGSVSFTGLDVSYCISNDTIKLTGSPEGGTFSGDGTSGNWFVPALAGAGTHQITYTYDKNGISCSQTKPVIINSLPVLNILGLNTSFCTNSHPITLTGVPSGGIFSGVGVVDSTFIPSIAGVGRHMIFYSYTDSNGCSNRLGQLVSILQATAVSFTGLDSAYCFSYDTIRLVGTPAGGTFSGDGISGNRFVPALAGAGIHQITYFYADSNGCSNSHSQSVTINNLPVLSLSGLNYQYCSNDPPVLLSATPSGGTLTGSGVIGGFFMPAKAGPGRSTVLYLYTDSNGCKNLLVKTVNVKSAPNVSFSGLNQQYCVNGNMSILTGTPAGGTFSGPGIVGNTFVPSLAGIGNHQITYSYSAQFQCTNSQTQSVTINGPIHPTVIGLKSQYCASEPPSKLSVTPKGTVSFSGAGIIHNSFSPELAGPGLHQIYYSYVDSNGCGTNQVYIEYVNVILPNVNFIGLNSQYGLNADTAILTGIPAGGTFTGNGIAGNLFIPALAGIGTHQITYSYTDQNGCSNSQTQSVIVSDFPVYFTGLNPTYFISDTDYILTGSPTGGIFSGDGMTGNFFNPMNAGIGAHTITYEYTNGEHTNSSSQLTTVLEGYILLLSNKITDVGHTESDDNSFKVYPNPAKDVLTIEIHRAKETPGTIYLINQIGEKVLKVKQGMLSNEKIEVNVSNLANGTYYVQVILTNEVLIKKVIIMKK